MKWKRPTRVANHGGWFYIAMSMPGYGPQNVSYFRGVPTQLDSFSSADPFGDSTASLTFPQITAFDDPNSPDLQSWFGLFSNVDIYWMPALDLDVYPGAVPFDTGNVFTDPITGKQILTPWYFTYRGTKISLVQKVWEGYVASIDYNSDDSGQSAQMQCQGALFQLDRYLQKPSYPPRPIPLESIIYQAMDPANKPHLRTKTLQIQWPSNWGIKVPARSTGQNAAYVLDAKAGANWTSYASRQTGSWDRVLTGFIQDQLSVMLVPSGSLKGSQWTIMNKHAVGNYANNLPLGIGPGRTPIMKIRDNQRKPDLSVWLGTPGINGSFSRDGTQMANIAYGDGTSVDGTTWRNSVISNDGSRTDYQPVAYIDNVWPYTNNKVFSKTPFVEEAYLKFGSSSQDQATASAYIQLRRDLDPGFTGSLTLAVDPTPAISRWTIQAGWTVNVKGLAGTANDGINFHISSVECSPSSGTVTLTLDTRYRDLLTVQEARARNRDPLTPTRMLSVNRTSVMLDDLSAPWSYNNGSGYVPLKSMDWWKSHPSTDLFPYVNTFKKYPPSKFPQFYVKVNANATTRAGRWTAVKILTAEKATIRRMEIICLDINGNILKLPFHTSLYYVKPTPTAMPRDKNGPSPFINNAFTTVDPATGNPWGPGSLLTPEPSFIIGWGSRVNGAYNRAGFYPGSEINGSPASGIFVDETTFSIDNTSSTNQNWNPNATVGQKQSADAISIWAHFYAENYKQPVYFLARMYRQEPGSS